MAFRCLKLLRVIKSTNIFAYNLMSTSAELPNSLQLSTLKQFKTETNYVYLEDPDKFGTLSKQTHVQDDILEDKGDINEQQYLENLPLHTQKLTIKQYADLIKQYLKYKRLKEAIDVLEVRMLTVDRVKPENYIYNILIGACADVGYTKKAFRLFNDMKRRSLKPTGDTYTCLFKACVNSPWVTDGLKHAKHLRELMLEKGVEPNLTNYNVMITAFGRCGDLTTAFKIVDEMILKKIKIRVHTFNHLLQACITDKNSGLRHALVVWRKMLKMKEKPNIYSFNLMLKCVKECNLGTKEDIEELISIINSSIIDNNQLKINNISQIDAPKKISGQNNFRHLIAPPLGPLGEMDEATETNSDTKINVNAQLSMQNYDSITDVKNQTAIVTSADVHIKDEVTFHLVSNLNKPHIKKDERKVPNLLSKTLQLKGVLSLQEVHTLQDKFAVIGGQDDFLKEMESYSVKPDVKTFTQMLVLLEDTREAEDKIIETMKSMDIKADIDFYNMLIKKRCFRLDYDGALDIRELIEKENKQRKKSHPWKKKLHLKVNIMTYGVLALACNTRETAEKILEEMKENQLKVNIEILGTLLRQGTVHNHFGYVLYIMNVVKEEKINVNNIFIKHLEAFVDKCTDMIQKNENGDIKCNEKFVKSYKHFMNIYNNWLKEVNVDEVLKPVHPWQQFREPYPDTIQRQNIDIKEPKKFYKINRRFVKYAPKLI